MQHAFQTGALFIQHYHKHVVNVTCTCTAFSHCQLACLVYPTIHLPRGCYFLLLVFVSCGTSNVLISVILEVSTLLHLASSIPVWVSGWHVVHTTMEG